MSGYYELKKTASGKFRFTLKAGNHEIILTGQTYKSKPAALKGMASVRTNGSAEASFERKTSAQGEPYFVLKAKNGQVIGTSEMYSTEAARDNGIASVVRNSPSEKVVDAATAKE